MTQQETVKVELTKEEANLLTTVIQTALRACWGDLEGYHVDIVNIKNKVEIGWIRKEMDEANQAYFGKSQ